MHQTQSEDINLTALSGDSNEFVRVDLRSSAQTRRESFAFIFLVEREPRRSRRQALDPFQYVPRAL